MISVRAGVYLIGMIFASAYGRDELFPRKKRILISFFWPPVLVA